jgi:ABC-2 type transport system ATP-binding protein
MADVTALCPRVIVIDHGKLVYDGNLSSLVKRVNPDKLVSLKLARPVARDDVARFGEIVEHSDAVAKVRVTNDRVREVVTAALAGLPVLDLTVEDPPLEDVMRQLFATSRADAEETAAKAAEQSA